MLYYRSVMTKFPNFTTMGLKSQQPSANPGCESMRSPTHFMSLTLDFQGQILQKPYPQEWDGWLTWNERDINWHQLWNLTLLMTLTLDFQGQILKKLVSEEWEGQLTSNERDVSREVIGLTITLTFDLTCDLELGFSRSNLRCESTCMRQSAGREWQRATMRVHSVLSKTLITQFGSKCRVIKSHTKRVFYCIRWW